AGQPMTGKRVTFFTNLRQEGRQSYCLIQRRVKVIKMYHSNLRQAQLPRDLSSVLYIFKRVTCPEPCCPDDVLASVCSSSTLKIQDGELPGSSLCCFPAGANVSRS
ncbi:unknown, partial [Simian retrovirus 1]